jgi:hypothetical protein
MKATYNMDLLSAIVDHNLFKQWNSVRFQVLTVASMMFRVVVWDILPCKMIAVEAVRTSETSVDNHFTRQYIPEDNSEQWNSVLWVYEAFKIVKLLWHLKRKHPV